jgi:hypothetical protein
MSSTKYAFPKPPRPSKKQHYIFAIPDVHVGYAVDHPTYSIPCWDVTIQALKKLEDRVTHVVIMGDFGNWECLSHWASLRADQCFVEEDVALVNNRLDEIQRIVEAKNIEVIFLEGNHEAWASQFEAKYPALRDAVNLQRRLRIKERGWTWVPENHFWAIGNLHFTHGHLKGCKNMVDVIKRTGVSVITGHWHTYETETLRTLTGEHAAWTIGTLASMDPPPPYVKGSGLSRVVQGFATVQVRTNGSFQVGFRRIVGQTWTELEDGTEIRADIPACQRRYAQDQAIREQMRKDYGDRFFAPGGQVVRTEPHHGKTGADHVVARNRRARIVRTLPEAK